MKSVIPFTQISRPYPLQMTSEQGGIQPAHRPQLLARWVFDTEGKLVCRWDVV